MQKSAYCIQVNVIRFMVYIFYNLLYEWILYKFIIASNLFKYILNSNKFRDSIKNIKLKKLKFF